jgi:hypothetical protein
VLTRAVNGFGWIAVAGRGGERSRPITREVIGVEIVIVESEADQIDPELVRHVP